MIIEFLKHLTIPSPSRLKEIGYLKELLAIQSRYNRCKQHWQQHVETTKQQIVESARTCKQHRKVVLMGTGLLLDIPVQELSQMFTEVLLIDIIHVPEVERYCRQFANVRCVHHDVTEMVNQLYELGTMKGKGGLPTHAVQPTYLLDDSEIDLVVSVNIMSQLPIMPQLYLERTCGFKESDFRGFNSSMVQQHLEYLRKFNASVLLITDVHRHLLDATGKIVDTENVIEHISLPKQRHEWKWDIAPRPEEYREWDVVHVVQSIPLREQAEETV